MKMAFPKGPCRERRRDVASSPCRAARMKAPGASGYEMRWMSGISVPTSHPLSMCAFPYELRSASWTIPCHPTKRSSAVGYGRV